MQENLCDRVFSRGYLVQFTLLLLLSYPLFYFSYKFCLPDFGGEDYYYYQYLYKDWDFAKVPAPFNMRIIGSFFIFLMNKIGLHYDTEIVFTTLHPNFSKEVFFNAMLFNYICVLLTCMVICRFVLRVTRNTVYGFVAGCTYLLGYGTLFFSLKPISDSCAILFVIIVFYYYEQKNYWLFPLMLLSIFQREYVCIAITIIACVDFYFQRDKFQLYALAGAVLFFAIYYTLRKTFFFTPRFDAQTSPKVFIDSLLNPSVDWNPFIKQTLLLSNLLFVYGVVLLYKKIKKQKINKNRLYNILFLLIQVMVMSIMAHFGNNAARFFYFISPILIYYIFIELKPLLTPYLNFKEDV